MTVVDLLVCGLMTVGLAQVFVRAEGGPGEWIRTHIVDPILTRIKLKKISDCTFCASVWFGFFVAALFFTYPEAVYVGAATFAGPFLLWLTGEVPRRKGMGCNKTVNAPTPPPETPNATTPGS
jgi:hypothetical protein